MVLPRRLPLAAAAPLLLAAGSQKTHQNGSGAKCCAPVAQMLRQMLHLKCLIINDVAPVAPFWPWTPVLTACVTVCDGKCYGLNIRKCLITNECDGVTAKIPTGGQGQGKKLGFDGVSPHHARLAPSSKLWRTGERLKYEHRSHDRRAAPTLQDPTERLKF